MGVIASIENAAVAAEPGAEASCIVRVRNTGMVVDQVLLDVLGESQSWATVEPAQLNLLPGADAAARVIFRPPRSSSVHAGMVPFGVRVMSQEDPAGSAIEEGVVEVGAFAELNAALVPRTSQGRRRSKHRLIIENKGNLATEASVSAADPDVLLAFRIKPETLTAEPGTATFVRVRTIPKKRFLKGPSKTIPFQTLVLSNGGDPVTTDGAMLQQQILPEWLFPALAVLTLAAGVLVALWFLVLKPEVHSAATQAVNQATQQLTASASKASQAAQQASSAAQRADTAAGTAGTAAAAASGNGPGGKKTSTTGSSGTSGSSGAPASGTPVSALLQSNAPPTSSATFSTVPYAVPARKTLSVTDVVLQNPLGDSGILQIRSGTTTLFEFGLANFRSIDYHFIQPLTFTTASPLELAVECKNPAGTNCTAGLSFSGTVHK